MAVPPRPSSGPPPPASGAPPAGPPPGSLSNPLVGPLSGPLSSLRSGPVSPVRAPRTMAGWFALVYAIGLIYGTLYPWSGWRRTGLSGLDFLSQPWPRYWTVFDLSTNVGLYAPLGALLGWWTRHRFGPWTAVALPIIVTALLATTLEALQTFLPGRIPSNIDLLCNVVGAVFGAAFALALWPTRLRDQPLRFRPHAKVTIVLLIAWLAVQALPQRLPFESGVLLGPLFDWIGRVGAAIDAPVDSAPVVLATQLAQALAPLQSGLGAFTAHRDVVEAGAVSMWLASIGLMLANVLTRSTWRPLAIGGVGRRRGRVLDFCKIGLVVHEAAYLVPLANAQVGRGVEAGALLDEGAHDHEAQRFGKFAQLGERCFELDVTDVRQLYGRHDGAHGLLFDFHLHSEIGFL